MAVAKGCDFFSLHTNTQTNAVFHVYECFLSHLLKHTPTRHLNIHVPLPQNVLLFYAPSFFLLYYAPILAVNLT